MTLSDQTRDLPSSGDWSELVDSLDVANCIRLLDREWNNLFKRQLSIDHRTWAKELMGVRNKVSHLGSQDMDKDDAERALDTMARLCAGFDLQGAEEIRTILRELRYGTSMGSTTVTAANAAPEPPKKKTEVGILTRISGSKLPSWREIIEPHPDVAQGRYLNAEFAADLSQVARGGVEMGLYPKEAQEIAMQTMKGAVAVLEGQKIHPEVAIDKVTTPGGLTIRGLNELDHAGFNSAVIRCLKAGLVDPHK